MWGVTVIVLSIHLIAWDWRWRHYDLRNVTKYSASQPTGLNLQPSGIPTAKSQDFTGWPKTHFGTAPLLPCSVPLISLWHRNSLLYRTFITLHPRYTAKIATKKMVALYRSLPPNFCAIYVQWRGFRNEFLVVRLHVVWGAYVHVRNFRLHL